MQAENEYDVLFRKGLAFFNGGKYFDAHETWEDLWRETTGPDRLLIQGLVQAAVALHHASTGNYTGARSVMARAVRNIGNRTAPYRGTDVANLRLRLQRLCMDPDFASAVQRSTGVKLEDREEP